VEDLVEEIGQSFTIWGDKPFAFYGHSLGAIVAFELSRQLSRSGGPTPFLLFAGAARPPHLKRPFPAISNLPDAEFLEAVQQRYGGIPKEIYADKEVLNVFLPMLRADFEAYETYRFEPGRPLEAPITVFSGDQDAMVSIDVLDQWAVHTSAGLKVNVLPGGHFFNGSSNARLVDELRIRLGADLEHMHMGIVRSGVR
jgi:medium-chain acyl-[acyl-carrier-protein] hydrolase